MVRSRSLAAVTAVMLFVLAVLGVLGALAAPAGAAGAKLLADPGFESGLSSWTCDAGTARTVASPVHGGAAALAGTPTSSLTGQCTQTVAVQPNSAYTLSAYVQGSYVYLGATGYSSTWTPSTSGWQLLTTSFTTGAGVTSVTVYLHGWYAQPVYYADDVSLTGPGGGPAVPGAPTGLTVTGTTASSVSLSWTASSGATGYNVYQGTSQVASVTGTTATVNGLSAGTAYTFSVTATNSAGESAHSSAVTATTSGQVQIPPAPTGLAVTGTTSSSVSLGWNASAGATGYDVYQGTTKVATATGTAATISGLSANTTYSFAVSATNSAGESAKSSAVSATTSAASSSPWHPSYLALGTVYTPGSSVDSFLTTMKSHGPVPNYGYEYLLGNDFPNWTATTTTLVNHAESFGMTPVLVEYGMNGNIDGTSVDYTNMQSSSWLTTYFQSLKNAATAANTAAPGKPVGWVIEPDMLGYLQQNYAAQYSGNAANMPAATSAAYSAGVLGGSDPTFGNNLKGLVEAIDYTIKKFDPTAFLGWQVNTWAVQDPLKDTDSTTWTAGRQAVVNTGTQVANFLGTADIGYRADFVAFDQWGQDFGYLRDPNPAGDIRYLNDAHWSNYLLYVQTIRSALNLPAVLWQIACGHLNSTQTPSPTYWNSSGKFPDLDDVTSEQYEDSASTFFFGDRFTSSGNNLAFYSSNPGADPKVSVSGSTVTWGSHLPDAASAGIVAILFGAGTGTGTYGVPEMVGANQSAPSDFDYWVTRAQSYLNSPAALP
jgi:chitodextrinase